MAQFFHQNNLLERLVAAYAREKNVQQTGDGAKYTEKW